MTFLRDRLLGAGGTDSDDTDEHLARRTASLFAVALIVVALGGLGYLLLRSDGSEPAASTEATKDIGPLPGTHLTSYIEARNKALADAEGDRVAVVSLRSYVPEADARRTVGPLRVTALLAAPPGGAPSTVTGPMSEWVDAQVAGSREERDELQKMLPTVDDPAFRQFYQEEVARLTEVVDAVKPDGPHVFALVVRGPAERLQELARDPVVRLVDVGGAQPAPGAVYRGLRPEETAKADDPPTRPL